MSLRVLATFALCSLQFAWAQRVGVPTDDLSSLSVDELFQIQVTSVGRKAQQLSKAPAAVFVLTAEDIRRSGATSIPEALQWVPGLTVLRVDGRGWTVSARGSAQLYSDKILVMIDGRSLYTPFFAGVLWDFVDVPMEDIEQIEVVRGPGAVMWGPNAVNGVINIISKRSRTTKGAVVTAAGGNELRGSILARWGAAPSDRLAYRIWGKVENRNPAFSSPGYYFFNSQYPYIDPGPVDDLDSKSARMGFRIDGRLSDKYEVMAQGDVYGTGRQESLGYPRLMPFLAELSRDRSDARGGFVQARLTRTTSPNSERSLQFTFDKHDIHYPFLELELNNMAVDYQNRQQTGEFNEIYWGVGYQQYWDAAQSRRWAGFNPANSVYRVGSVVVRDELQVIPSLLLASVGMRLDYSSYTRFEFQPSFRLLYTPSARQSAWVAVSRAVRVPSRFDRDLFMDAGLEVVQDIPMEFRVAGSTRMRSETMWSAEAGYRLQSGQRWSLDTSSFWSYYHRLRALSIPSQPEIRFDSAIPSFHMFLTEENAGAGRSYGSETWLTWQVRPGWRLIPSYSFLDEVQWIPSKERYAFMLNPSGSRHQPMLRSQFDFSDRWQLDLMSRARSRNVVFDLPGVVLVDARLSYRPLRDSEISFSARNITGRKVLETYSESVFAAIPTQRTFVARWTQRF